MLNLVLNILTLNFVVVILTLDLHFQYFILQLRYAFCTVGCIWYVIWQNESAFGNAFGNIVLPNALPNDTAIW